MPRGAFPGYDDPVNIEGEPEDVPKVLLGDEVLAGRVGPGSCRVCSSR
jgi:hypothetical protein